MTLRGRCSGIRSSRWGSCKRAIPTSPGVVPTRRRALPHPTCQRRAIRDQPPARGREATSHAREGVGRDDEPTTRDDQGPAWPARARVAPSSRPLMTISVRLWSARARLATMSEPLVTISVRLSPARALVATIRGPLATIRVRLSPARALAVPISGPLATIRALRLTMRRHLSTQSGSLPRKRPFSSEFSSSCEDKIERMRPRSTARRDGPFIAQARQASGDVNVQRHEARHRAADGRRFV